MFPLADRRGRVRGFGARAMRDGQGPKYVNTREGEVFTKGRQLFGVDIARAAAAKAGAVVLAEGYTDVIALHQAGFANAVASMGTALTAEQASELGNLAPLDPALPRRRRRGPDRRGARRLGAAEPARAARRAAPVRQPTPRTSWGRRAAPSGCSALLDRAVPFARFQVERTLERALGADASAQDHVLDEVAKVIRPLQGGIVRDDLVKLASGRLGISPELVEGAIRSAVRPDAGARHARRRPAAARPTAPARRSTAASSPSAPSSPSASRCPELGEKKLAEADLDTVFTSPLTRLAAERLRGHLQHPASILGDEDELAELVPEIVIHAGRLDATPATLELEALQLDLHRLDREISAAVHTGTPEGAMSTLAAERQRVLDAIRHRLQ